MSDKVEPEQFWRDWQISEHVTHHTIDDWPIRLLKAYAAASSRAPEGAARTSTIAALEAEWLSQDKILDYRNWLQDKLLQSRASHAHSGGAQENALEVLVARWEEYYEAFTSPHHTVTAPPDAMKGLRQCIDELKRAMGKLAHSEGVDTKELAELRAIVGRCEKTSPGVLGGRCDRPKGHRGSHETRNGMTTWLGPNDEPELSEGVDGWVRTSERLPEDSTYVLVVCNHVSEQHVTPCFMKNGRWMSEFEVTHWRPLPAPPKEGE